MHKTLDVPKGCGTQIALIDQYDLFLGTLIDCPYLEEVSSFVPAMLAEQCEGGCVGRKAAAAGARD